MVARVTATEVKLIISTTLSDAVVDVFINAANLTVTELVGSSTELSSDQLKEIERWLTAHLLASTREQQPQSESVGGASISYQGQTAIGLDATFYGQQVKLLDATGTLARNLGKKRAAIEAVTTRDIEDWGIS